MTRHQREQVMEAYHALSRLRLALHTYGYRSEEVERALRRAIKNQQRVIHSLAPDAWTPEEDESNEH